MSENMIIIPLCPKNLSKIAIYEPDGGEAGISASKDEGSGLVTIRMASAVRKCPDEKVIEVHMQCVPGPWFDLGENNDAAEACISVGRDPESVDAISGDVTSVEPNPTIRLKIPDHCLWVESRVTAHPAESDPGEIFAITQPLDEPPVFTGDYDGGCDGVRDTMEYMVRDHGIIVPGYRLKGRHTFYNGKNTAAIHCGGVWYRACAMTGGRIIAVNGDYDTETITYDVSVQGVTVTGVIPTDFVNYEVGDWVFLVDVSDDGCALECGSGANFRIVPAKCGEEGA